MSYAQHTTSFATLSEKESNTLASGGNTRTARMPFSFSIDSMCDMNASIASKSNLPSLLVSVS